MEKKEHIPHINVDYFENLTGDIPTDQVRPAENMATDDIGERVRKLRQDKGLSLEALSNLTGFDVTTLKDIEDSKIQPQLGTIMKLSKALDSAFSRLLSGVGTQLYSITRKNDQKIVSRSTSETGVKKLYTYKSLAPEVKGRHMEALIVQLEECLDETQSIHEGEEFIYVLDGIVQIKIGDHTCELEPGDSIYYLSTMPHLVSAKRTRATILAVVYDG